jgi:Glutathione S-transferase, C-terminal domain
VRWALLEHHRSLNVSDIPSRCPRRLLQSLDRLDHALAGRDYLVGDRFTIADLSVLPRVGTYPLVQVPLDDGRYPNVARWVDTVGRRPSVVPERGGASGRWGVSTCALRRGHREPDTTVAMRANSSVAGRHGGADLAGGQANQEIVQPPDAITRSRPVKQPEETARPLERAGRRRDLPGRRESRPDPIDSHSSFPGIGTERDLEQHDGR